MDRRRRSTDVDRLVGCKHMTLRRGFGYWYFDYDDGEYQATRTVMVSYLNALPLDSWVEIGKAFAADAERRAAKPDPYHAVA